MISISKEKLEKKLDLLRKKLVAYDDIYTFLTARMNDQERPPLLRYVYSSVWRMVSNSARMINLAITMTEAELAETD